MPTEGIGRLKTSSDLTGNRTQNLPSHCLVTQATAPPFAPSYLHSVAPKASNLCLNQSQLLKNIPKNNSKAL